MGHKPRRGRRWQGLRTRLRGDRRDRAQGARPRAVDLLIAATALAADLPLYTRNVDDFRGIQHLLIIVAV
jgi:predicted nucleic acid-binding protein